MSDYQRVSTVKIARPDTPEGYMIINASDYRAGLPQYMYEEGLAYDPAVWKPYVEPVLKAPAAPQSEAGEGLAATDAPAPSESPSHPESPARGRLGSSAGERR
jgi:hypothetical protein